MSSSSGRSSGRTSSHRKLSNMLQDLHEIYEVLTPSSGGTEDDGERKELTKEEQLTILLAEVQEYNQTKQTLGAKHILVIQRKVELLHKIQTLGLTSDDAFRIRQSLMNYTVHKMAKPTREEIEMQERRTQRRTQHHQSLLERRQRSRSRKRQE